MIHALGRIRRRWLFTRFIRKNHDRIDWQAVAGLTTQEATAAIAAFEQITNLRHHRPDLF